MTVEDNQSTRKRKNFWFHPAGVTPPLVLLAATKTARKPFSISIHPSSFPSVSYVSGYRPKSVLARHAPYLLNNCIKIYTFNSRQQPTYQHSTFFSSSLPSLSNLFPFQIRKTRPQRLPPLFFFFFKRLGSVLRSFVIHILVNNWAYMWLTPIYVLRMRADLKGGGSRFTNNTTFTASSFQSRTAGGRCLHRDHPPKSPYSLAQWTPRCHDDATMQVLQRDGQTLARQVGWSTAAGMYVRYLCSWGWHDIFGTIIEKSKHLPEGGTTSPGTAVPYAPPTQNIGHWSPEDTQSLANN